MEGQRQHFRELLLTDPMFQNLPPNVLEYLITRLLIKELNIVVPSKEDFDNDIIPPAAGGAAFRKSLAKKERSRNRRKSKKKVKSKKLKK